MVWGRASALPLTLMKIKVRTPFGVMVGTAEVKFSPRVYRVPDDMSQAAADFALRQRYAVVMPEKVAPENKLAEVPENKAAMAGPAVRRRRKRSKSGGDSEA